MASNPPGRKPFEACSVIGPKRLTRSPPAESLYNHWMPIRQLSETMINQIAAGEVIERPASVVKELVENALDAGATRVEIATAGGGLSLIRVVDDGAGIAASELMLAVARHCTSKLSSGIHDIRSLGFRGEALPSIGSVARLADPLAHIRCGRSRRDFGRGRARFGGEARRRQPRHLRRGARPLLRHARRLKFMKGERAESSAISDVVKRIAIAFPAVRFTLSGTDRSTLDLPATDDTPEGYLRRIAQVMGADFPDNSLPIDAAREDVALSGHVSIPSYTRANALQQYAYVNGRPVRDKLISGAVRGAFADVLPRDRHAVTVLFLTLDPALVDVNVHPAKADVRFRDPGLVRGLIVGAIRQALAAAGIRSATTGAAGMLGAFRPGAAAYGHAGPANGHRIYDPAFRASSAGFEPSRSPYRPLDMGFGEERSGRLRRRPGRKRGRARRHRIA